MAPTEPSPYVGRHLRFGWWSLLAFLTLGFVLETLHGFKAGLYLDVGNETRRLMWTLAHAHGALLGLLHVVVGLALRLLPDLAGAPRLPLISTSLVAASVLLPGGFFLGGVRFYGGDPGVGIVLVPIGAASLLLAVALLARASTAPAPTPRGRR